MSWDCRGTAHFTCVIAGRWIFFGGFDSCRGHIFSLIYDQLFLLFMLCFWGKFTIVSYGHLWPLMVPHVVGLSWELGNPYRGAWGRLDHSRGFRQ